MGDGLRLDLLRATRRWRRAPGAGLLAASILTVGIAATATVASVADSLLFLPLPFPDGERLVLIQGVELPDGGPFPLGPVELDEVAADGPFAAASPVTWPRPFKLGGEGSVEQVFGEMARPSYFTVLGIAPALGRTFLADEDRSPGAARVVVLGHDLWQRAFGGRAEAVGEDVELQGARYRVVGVMPAGFRGISDEAELWLPLSLADQLYGPHYTTMRAWRWLGGVARLPPGEPLATARRELAALRDGLARVHPEEYAHVGFSAEPLREVYFGELRQPLLLLLAASVGLLLIACANAANLFLARSLSQVREIAVSRSVGAPRGRLLRQLLVESAFPIVLGTAGGLAVAVAALAALAAASPIELASWIELRLSPRSVGVTVALVALCALAAALAPALLVSARRPQAALRDATRGAAGGGMGGRLRRAMVIVQALLVVVLLGASATVGRGLARFSSTDLGFEPRHLLTLRLDLTGERYAEDDAVRSVVATVLERLGGLPGVVAVAAQGPGLPTSGSYGVGFRRPGDAEAPPLEGLRHHVWPGYFQALRIPLLAGRGFTAADGAESPRALVVSRSFAERSWPGEEPIGQRLEAGQAPDLHLYTVVGVAEDVRHQGLSTNVPWAPDVYLCALQSPPRNPPLVAVLVRSEGSAVGRATAVEAAVRQAAPDLPPYDVTTMEDRLREQTAFSRFVLAILVCFTASSLLLAVAGVYGLIAATVASRRRETGLRIALGASPGRVLRRVLGHELLRVGAGGAAGIGVLLLLRPWLSGLSYEFDAADPMSLVAAFGALLLAVLAAGLPPARRAATTDPASALREEEG